MSYLSKLFGKAYNPPPSRTNKTLEQRKAELLSTGRASFLSKTEKRSKSFASLFIIVLIFFVFFALSSLFSNKETVSDIVLSPLYPDYSALADITANTDIICRAVVIERGTPKKLTVKDEKKSSKKVLFTPVLLNVITPIKGDFENHQFSYLELGGQTATQNVEVSGMLPLNVDDEVFLFSNSNRTGFGKWSVIYVENEYVVIESERLPSSVASDEKYTRITAEDFARLIDSLIE